MNYTIAWSLILLATAFLAPNPIVATAMMVGVHLVLWTLLCGGIDAIKEILEAKTQPDLPLQALDRVDEATMVVIGAYSGLGKEVADLARRKRYNVVEGDVMFVGDRHCDLTSVPSIKAFAKRCVRKVDVLVLVAGVCDATGVPVAGSTHPRMLWVNLLGQVCVIEEFKTLGIDVAKIVVVSSGSYARGSPSAFYAKTWGMTEAIKYYSQSKFLLTAYFSSLKSYGSNVVLINPGPMRSTIGDRHVPLLLWPTFGLMKEWLFPWPSTAAKAVLWCADTKTKLDYMHIRRPAELNATVRDAKVQQWVIGHVKSELSRFGYFQQ